ncbi:MAG: carboxylating nicotinate-nucleotide diphosphorylase [Calditrichaeota bacterium]|nr:MAG: carboxylating nicotinate-nucleotide diphosphorylase [Calditrichota bacterium]
MISTQTKKLVKIALTEDILTGDVTSEAIFHEEEAIAAIYAKANGIISGLEVANEVCHQIDKGLNFQPKVKNGEEVKKKQIVAVIAGKTVSILKAERVMLNFLQRLSGVATRTNNFTKLLNGYKTQIFDTRKTTPGMRFLEKEAVLNGNGKNHRIGLYDQALIKDNHIEAVGGITEAVNRVVEFNKGKENFIIVVETKNLEEIKEALELPVTRIMIDNFSPKEAEKAVKFVNGRKPLEASGGITEENIVEYAKAGVDFISIGALTHSVKALDLSLLIK